MKTIRLIEENNGQHYSLHIGTPEITPSKPISIEQAGQFLDELADLFQRYNVEIHRGNMLCRKTVGAEVAKSNDWPAQTPSRYAESD